MDTSEKTIKTFSTRVRQMILAYQSLEAENHALRQRLDEKDDNVKQLEAALAKVQRDYETLKMARMIQVTDGDLEKSKKRLSLLIRDVNKCITLLSGK